MKKGISLLKTRLATAQQTAKVLEPVYAKILPNAHPHSALRQKVGGRWYSTTVNNLIRFTTESTPRLARGPSVRTAVAGRLTTTSPFGSTLRPMLTGGAIPRTTSGYSLGGHGARYFSHSPTAPAQVMSQVSAAMRAFLHSGKGQVESYRHHDDKLGRIGVRAQLAASLALENAPGAYVDFDLSPTITCISQLNRSNCSLENENFLEDLSSDFGAMISGLVVVNADIRRLTTLGDLPVSLVGLSGNTLRVHFHGCDRDLVEKLCDEVGVRRGVIHEDERFAFAMLAPGGVVSWKDMMSDSPPLSSTYSDDGFDDELSSSDGYIKSRITGSDSLGGDDYFELTDGPVMVGSPGYHSSDSSGDYGGLQAIHMFLAECEEYHSFRG